MPRKKVSVKFLRRLKNAVVYSYTFTLKVELKFSINAFISILFQCPQYEMFLSFERNLFSMMSAQLAKNMFLRVSINNWMRL